MFGHAPGCFSSAGVFRCHFTASNHEVRTSERTTVIATISKVGVSLATALPPASCKITGLLAGEAIAAGDCCYIKSDGKVWRSNGTAATAPAAFDGMAFVAAAVGEAVTLHHSLVVNYGAGLTPGAALFISATAGALDDAATTGGTKLVARVIDATRIQLRQSNY